jgi:hypothetical protein
MQDKNIKNLFATEITEATEGFKFKNQRKRLMPEESVLRVQS